MLHGLRSSGLEAYQPSDPEALNGEVAPSGVPPAPSICIRWRQAHSRWSNHRHEVVKSRALQDPELVEPGFRDESHGSRTCEKLV